MMLVVGGRGAGKRAFAMEYLGLADEDFSRRAEGEEPAVYDAQELARGGFDEALVEALASKRVVIADEVGSGVVPASEEERKWRDDAGLLCQELAKRADVVVRVICGVPQAIKGELA